MIRQITLPYALIILIAASGLAVAGAVTPNDAATPTEIAGHTTPGTFDIDSEQEAMRQLQGWLYAERVTASELAPASLGFTAAELDDLEKGFGKNEQRIRVGLAKELSIAVDFAGPRFGATSTVGLGSMRPTIDDGFVWTGVIESKGAAGLRVRLTDVDLPPQAALYVYNDRGEAFGPYTGRGPLANGEFWSNTIFGDRLWLQLRVAGPASADVVAASSFNIAEAGHIGSKFLIALGGDDSKAFCTTPANAACIQNAKCSTTATWAQIDNVRNAIAHMLFKVGANFFICTGGLMADTDSSSAVPYFLTANHCMSTQASATSLETYFKFMVNCNAACVNRTGFPRVLGSTLLSTATATDHTLVQLSAAPPAGSFFLGWSSTAVHASTGTALYRISHPKGAPQAFSRHSVDTAFFGCGALPRPNFIYSADTFGATEGGSSGSPVMLANGAVVGQLFGACGTNLGNVCDAANNRTVDGAFAAYFSQVKQFLSPTLLSDPTAMSNANPTGGDRDEPMFAFPGQGIHNLVDQKWVKLHTSTPKHILGNIDLDGSGKSDMIVDFGPAGIWARMNNSAWVKLHSFTSESMVAANLDRGQAGDTGDELIIDFGPAFGIWVLYNNATWKQIHSISPDSMTSGDLDETFVAVVNIEDELIVDFGPRWGVWVLYNNKTWAKIHPLSPEMMITADIDFDISSGFPRDDVVMDFGPVYGIWVLYNNTSWKKIHPTSPVSMTSGPLNAFSPAHEVIVDFGAPHGIWVLWDNSTWSKIHNSSSQGMITGDIGGNTLYDDLIIDFGALGTWALFDGMTWWRLPQAP